MRNFREKYPYNKVHTAVTRAEIMKHLAEADETRDIRKAKSTSGMANAVEEGLNYLSVLVGSQSEDHSSYGEAYVTSMDIDLSTERSAHSRRHRKKDRR